MKLWALGTQSCNQPAACRGSGRREDQSLDKGERKHEASGWDRDTGKQ